MSSKNSKTTLVSSHFKHLTRPNSSVASGIGTKLRYQSTRLSNIRKSSASNLVSVDREPSQAVPGDIIINEVGEGDLSHENYKNISVPRPQTAIAKFKSGDMD